MLTDATASPKVRSAAFGRASLVIALVLALDQVIKHTVAAGIRPGQEQKFLPGVQLVHVRNTGVAFSLFSGGGALVPALTLAALAILVGYFVLRPDRQGLWLAVGLLVGGALGNLIDRVANGAVVDFIKLPLWPAFNIADMAITFGLLVLLWVLEGARRDEHR